jgi:hypothetical protein
MDTTIRNLDEDAFRRLKARAAAEGKTLGEALSEAMRDYASWPWGTPKTGSLGDLKPRNFGKGTEHLSQEIDAIVYGV